jgi:hypothetical protein
MIRIRLDNPVNVIAANQSLPSKTAGIAENYAIAHKYVVPELIVHPAALNSVYQTGVYGFFPYMIDQVACQSHIVGPVVEENAPLPPIIETIVANHIVRHPRIIVMGKHIDSAAIAQASIRISIILGIVYVIAPDFPGNMLDTEVTSVPDPDSDIAECADVIVRHFEITA